MRINKKNSLEKDYYKAEFRSILKVESTIQSESKIGKSRARLTNDGQPREEEERWVGLGKLN